MLEGWCPRSSKGLGSVEEEEEAEQKDHGKKWLLGPPPCRGQHARKCACRPCALLMPCVRVGWRLDTK